MSNLTTTATGTTVLWYRATNGLWVVAAYPASTLIASTHKKFLYESEAVALFDQLVESV